MARKKSKPTVELEDETPEFVSFDHSIQKKFMEDWESARERHDGQKQVLEAIFSGKYKYIFQRAGRKFSKTTTLIDAGWRLAYQIPNSVGYLCYPTIAQGIEVVWEEKRLQRMDLKDDSMIEKYVEKIDDNKHLIRFNNGSYIKVVGTWSEAKGRGGQPDFMLHDEVQDSRSEYLNAMDSNLAAKPNSICIMSGTPPKKRNHYNEWWDRIGSNKQGKCFKFTSYDNTSLPHLKEWLDNKKIELIKAGKEDEWLREYMAEDCFSSSDRILPDAKFIDSEEIFKMASNFAMVERIPLVSVVIHPRYVCAAMAILIARKKIFVIDHMVFPQVWNKSFMEMFPKIAEKSKEVQSFCGQKTRNLVWDESDSFTEVISGFTKNRKDLKWQDRGIPLLREMMINDRIVFSQNVADFGLECQNMLMDESRAEVEKNYPHICNFSMLVNEYFQNEKISIPQLQVFDKYEGLRAMGLPCPPLKKPGKNLFKIGL